MSLRSIFGRGAGPPAAGGRADAGVAAPRGDACVDVGSASAIGRRRENQDRCFVDHGLALVSDGMGGHRGGAQAAELSVAAAREVLGDRRRRDARPADEGLVRAAFEWANERVRAGRAAQPELAEMGATLTIAAAADDGGARWLVANVGDSPALLVTDTTVLQVSADHSAAAHLAATGAITEAEAAVHHLRHVLLRVVGGAPEVQADVHEVHLEVGDALALLSDGVSGALAPAAIGDLVRGAPTGGDAADALVDAALAAGASDNVTAVVVRRVASSVRA